MTPDKVEAALGVLFDRAEGRLGIVGPSNAEALSVLTEALAERGRDAARLDWLDSQSADGVHLEVCHKGSWAEGDLVKTATVFIGRKEFTARNSRIAIDAAMKETP